MIPIEELEKVLQGCISRTLKRVGRKEFIDLFNYLDKANELNKQLAADNSRLRKAIEEAIKHQEIVGGSLSKMSTTVRILRNALEGK